MACNKNRILKKVRDELGLDQKQIKALSDSMPDIGRLLEVDEDLRIGDELGMPAPVEVQQEYDVDKYEAEKQVLINQMNKDKPKIQHTKNKSAGYVVPIEIQKIVGHTAYYTYHNSDKLYEIPANSKFIKLKDKDINTMIREFAEATDGVVAEVKPNQVLTKEQLGIINKKRNECS